MKSHRMTGGSILNVCNTVFGLLTRLPLRTRFGLPVVAALLLSLLPAAAEAAPGDFGAIAYSPSTKVASFGAGGSQSSAQNAAVAGCKSRGGGNDCAAYLWFENGYGALASSGNHFGTGWGTNAQYAARYAIRICQQHGGTNCAVVYAAHTSDTSAESPSARGGAAQPSLTPPVPMPVPTPSGTPPSPLLTSQQQEQLRNLFKTAKNEQKGVSCGLYIGKNLYQLVLWANQIGIAYGGEGLPDLPPPSGSIPTYTGQCHFIDWQQLTLVKIISWPMSDPLLGVPDPGNI